MKKETAYALLGGSHLAVARWTGLSIVTVRKWPDVLSRAHADRVIAGAVRMEWDTNKRLGILHLYRERLELLQDAHALPDDELIAAEE